MSDPFASTEHEVVGDDPFGNEDELGAYGADTGGDGDGGGFDFGDGDDLGDLGAGADAGDVGGGDDQEDAFGLLGGDDDAGEGATEANTLGDFGGDADEGVTLQSSKYLEWENEHLNEIGTKREKARVEKEDARDKAREELDNFHRERQDRIAKAKAQNAEDERNGAAELSMVMENGSSWEKVGKLVNLNSNKDTSGITKNDRLRKLLIQLKNEGASTA